VRGARARRPHGGAGGGLRSHLPLLLSRPQPRTRPGSRPGRWRGRAARRRAAARCATRRKRRTLRRLRSAAARAPRARRPASSSGTGRGTAGCPLTGRL